LNTLHRRIYLATIAEDASEIARSHGLGLEIDEFCTAMNMDEAFPEWEAKARAHLAASDRFIFHAPFAELTPCAVDPLAREFSLRRLNQAAALSRRCGIRRMVVHSGFIPQVYFPEWFIEQGAAFFREFLAGQPEDFEIMIENVLDPDPAPLLALVEAIGDRRAGLCLDVGHANVASKVPVRDWLAAFAPALTHLHLHDNDGSHDFHALPGDGTIGFPGILAEIDRLAPAATLTFECLDAAGCAGRLRDFGILP